MKRGRANAIQSHLDIACEFTPKLRSSEDEYWPAIRAFLLGIGVDSSSAAIGDIYPDQGLIVVVAASNGRVVELDVDEPIEWAGRTGGVESWKEVDSPLWRYIHSIAIHAAQVLLEEESPGSIDPIEVLTEFTAYLTAKVRSDTDSDWEDVRRVLLEGDLDPERSIFVDMSKVLSPEPWERRSTLLFEGRWFVVEAALNTDLIRTHGAASWQEIDEVRARELHGALVDAALRLAEREQGSGGSE